MSFRSYLAIMDKKEAQQIENMTWKEIHDKYNIEYPFEFTNKLKIMFEFGSYSNFDEDILKNSNYLFKRKETRLLFSEYYCKKVNEKNFLKIIDILRNETKKYYEDIESNIDKALKYIEIKKNKWSNKDMPPYNLNKNTDYIIDDNSYEYNIFELVRIYKQIDFSKQQILFIGY